MLAPGQFFESAGYPTFAEMEYIYRRHYSLMHSEKHIEFYVGTREIGKEGNTTMGKLAQHQAENGPIGGHWATDDEKATLASFGMPFALTDIMMVQSTFKGESGKPVEYIAYHVRLDALAPEYKQAVRRKQVDWETMEIRLPADPQRLGDVDVLKAHYVGKTDEGSLLTLCGYPTKNGRTYYKIEEYSSAGE
jgi:hypothetical protein